MSDQTYLYRFYAERFELLYIGITSALVERFEAHMKGKAWWSDVRHIDIARYESRSEALTAERLAIVKEGPRYNVQHGTAAPKPPERVVQRGDVLTSPADLRYVMKTWGVRSQAMADVFGVSRQAVAKWLTNGVPAARIAEIEALAIATELAARASGAPLAARIRQPITTDERCILEHMREASDVWQAVAVLEALLFRAA